MKNKKYTTDDLESEIENGSHENIKKILSSNNTDFNIGTALNLLMQDNMQELISNIIKENIISRETFLKNYSLYDLDKLDNDLVEIIFGNEEQEKHLSNILPEKYNALKLPIILTELETANSADALNIYSKHKNVFLDEDRKASMETIEIMYRNGHKNIVSQLLKDKLVRPADINKELCVVAVGAGHKELVQALLKRKSVKVNTFGSSSISAVRDPEIATMLLADDRVRYNDFSSVYQIEGYENDNTPFKIAIENGNEKLAIAFLQSPKTDSDEDHLFFNKIIYDGVSAENLKTNLDEFISKDLTTASSICFLTRAIGYAAKTDNIKAIDFIASSGAVLDLNLISDQQQRELIEKRQRIVIMQKKLAGFDDLKAPVVYSFDDLISAVKGNDLEKVKIIAELQDPNIDYYSAFYHSVELGDRYEIFNYLSKQPLVENELKRLTAEKEYHLYTIDELIECMDEDDHIEFSNIMYRHKTAITPEQYTEFFFELVDCDNHIYAELMLENVNLIIKDDNNDFLKDLLQDKLTHNIAEVLDAELIKLKIKESYDQENKTGFVSTVIKAEIVSAYFRNNETSFSKDNLVEIFLEPDVVEKLKSIDPEIIPVVNEYIKQERFKKNILDFGNEKQVENTVLDFVDLREAFLNDDMKSFESILHSAANENIHDNDKIDLLGEMVLEHNEYTDKSKFIRCLKDNSTLNFSGNETLITKALTGDIEFMVNEVISSNLNTGMIKDTYNTLIENDVYIPDTVIVVLIENHAELGFSSKEINELLKDKDLLNHIEKNGNDNVRKIASEIKKESEMNFAVESKSKNKFKL